MSKLKSVVLFAAIIVLTAITSQAAFADSVTDRSITVILADRVAIGQSEGSAEAAQSMVGLLSNLREGRQFAYVEVDNPSVALGPEKAGEINFAAFESQVTQSLNSASVSGESDILAALGESFNFLISQNAVAGSEVYLITGGPGSPVVDNNSDHLALILDFYAKQQWSVTSVALPDSPSELTTILERFSTETGGQFFELSVPDGLKSITDSTFLNEAHGSLVGLGSTTVSLTDVFTSVIEIAPGTHEATMLFFKEDTGGSLRLSNPEGFEASDGDRAISSVVETPNLVIWKLVDPVPGEWKVDVRGVEGAVSGWHSLSNRYSLALASYESIPVDKASTLVAFVSDDAKMVQLEGVEVSATVTTPDGISSEYTLNDNGVVGDSVIGDGFYSINLPPLGTKGDYAVTMLLTWQGFERQITSQAAFSAQAFPDVEVTPVQLSDIRPGQTVKVATAFVHVEGEPYAVFTDQLSATVSSEIDANGTIQIVPQQLLDQNRSWIFDVMFTPTEEGLHTLAFALDIEYGGRAFKTAVDALVLSSVMPAVSAPSVPAPAIPVVSAPETPAVVLPQPSPVPWTFVIVVLAIIGIATLALIVYWVSRTRPYGFLYTDRNELIVDFSALKRPGIRGILSRNSVTGLEIGAKGLERVSFKFEGERVGINTEQTTPTIRVNNQPVVGETVIHDRTWIGAHGKLYSFLLSPLMQDPQAAVGDD